jgi:hypothetical protein
VAGGGLDSRRAGSTAIVVLAALCAGLLAAELLYEPHAHFGPEARFGFHALYGGLAIVGIVLGGRLLRRLVMRREDFYD